MRNKYSFHTGIPDGYSLPGDLSLFHNPLHLTLQAPRAWKTFAIVDEAGHQLSAFIQFHLHDDIARSPYRAPFGSFHFSSVPPISVLQQFVMFMEDQLQKNEIKKISIKGAPEIYEPQSFALIKKVLLDSDYCIALEEVSSVIQVTELPFEAGLNRAKRQALKDCIDHGFTWSLLPREELDRVYQFLQTWRKPKGYSLSMTWEELKALTLAFPDRILLSALQDKDDWIAAGIAIHVTKKILYHFYFDHAATYNHVSPVILLNRELYNFCQINNIEMLDLGTSTVADKLKTSLLRFKQELGAVNSPKLTFEKSFS